MQDQLEKCQQTIENLEMRIAFQDDTIEQLNQVVCGLQDEMGELKFKLSFLTDKMKNFAPSDSTDQNVQEIPPHY